MNIATTMRALQQTSLDGPKGLRLVLDAPVPTPHRGEVLIRVEAAGINFVDLARAQGTFGETLAPPFVAGFEAAGEVVARGEGVQSPALGARVVAAGAGAFAEYVAVAATAAAPLPSGWSAEQGLGLAINWPTALAALRLGRISPGETALIHAAAGATGQAAVKLAKRFGARVIAAASASKHHVVRALGADEVVDARDPDLAAAVRARTGGRGADLVLESAGGDAFEQSLAATRHITGRVVVIGSAGGDATVRNWDLVYRHPVQIIGMNLGALIRSAPEMFGQVMRELGELIAAGVVTPAQPAKYSLAEGAGALMALESRSTVGKLALIP